MAKGIEVIQNLRVFSVESIGDELRVDIYGGPECVCGSLRYTFEDSEERQARLDLLERWRVEATLVTYVCRDDAGALLDERSLLDDALNA
ncbi:MAG TPA: hypothetical protein VMZ51_02875 [Acidimicrobiales bacterium]|nr:hypothetical protein [Acidimicrobiales bacterium]